MWDLTIGGVSKRTAIQRTDPPRIELPFNERATATFLCEPSYFPALRSEVVIYDQDGTTPIFGGIIHDRQVGGFHGSGLTKVTCTDFSWYFDRITVDSGSLGTVNLTLEQILDWFQANYLSAYGFTLDAAQATGPTIPVSGFTWERMSVTEAFRDYVTPASGGWVFKVSPTKVWGFYSPDTATPSAPFSISNATAPVREPDRLRWTDSSADYATRIIVVWGGQGTREKVEPFEVTSGIISAGYYDTELASTPTGGVTATINASPVTIGASGSVLLWSFDGGANGVARVTAGTYTPVLGDDIVITYTAQYPGEATADGAVSPPIVLTVKRDDIADEATAQATANGLLLRHFQDPKTFEIPTNQDGLRPGQVISIQRTDRDISTQNALITKVAITLRDDTTWEYTATAIGGIYQGSPLDFFRGGFGSGTSAIGGGVTVVNYTEGVNPVEVTVAGQPLTRVNDTNVTVTLGGDHATALVNAASLTMGWSGQLGLTRGGTNASLTPINGGVAYSTASALGISAAGSSNDVLRSGGAGAPTWSAPAALTKADDTNVTLTLGGSPSTSLLAASSLTLGWNGQLAVPRGGTGLSTLTTNRIPYGNGTSAFQSHADLTFNGTTFATSAATFSGHIQHPSYASQTSNWRITSDGQADFRYLFTDELHAKAFVADLEMALAGGQIITKSVAVVSQTFSVPAAGASGTLWVRDLPSASNMAAFVPGDLVSVRSFTRANGGLIIGDAYGIVTGYTDGTSSNEGQQSWTFTRLSGSDSGTLFEGATIEADSIVLDYGVSGSGYYEATAIDGTVNVNSITRSGSTATLTSAFGHGYQTGDTIVISGADQSEYNGAFQITVSSSTVFAYAVSGTPDTPATGTIIMANAQSALSVSSITRSSSTATATTAFNHGYATGDVVFITGASQSEYNGQFTITVTGATTFTYTVSGAPATPATGTIFTNGSHTGNAPYAQIVTWSGSSPRGANRTVRTRFGNLRGITGTANEYGFFAGTWNGGNGPFFRASNNLVVLANVPFSVTSSGTPVFHIDPAVPSVALGASLPTFTTGTGWWTGLHSGAYKFRVGTTAGNRIVWDGTNLTVVSEALSIDSSGIRLSTTSTAGFDAAKAFYWSTGLGSMGLTGHESGNDHTLYAQVLGGTNAKIVLEADGSGGPVSLTLAGGSNAVATLNCDDLDINASDDITIDADLVDFNATAVQMGTGIISTLDTTLFTLSGTATLDGICSPSQITSNQNDYNPSGLSTCTILRFFSDAARDITGLAGGVTGRTIFILNYGAYTITLKGENASSSTNNRFALVDFAIASGRGVGVWWDGDSGRWRYMS